MSLRTSVNLTDVKTSLRTLTVAGLKLICAKLSISSVGRKEDLINQITKNWSNASTGIEENVTVHTEEAEITYRVNGNAIQRAMTAGPAWAWKFEFKPKRIGGYDWTLVLQCKEDPEWLQVLIKYSNCNSNPPPLVMFEYSFKKINERTNEVMVQHARKWEKPRTWEDHLLWGWPNDLDIKGLKTDLHESRLEYKCKFTIYGENETEENCMFQPHFMKLGQNIQENVDADFNIVMKDGSELPAHRFVLEASSPVLKAMLHHEVHESINQKMQIDDFEPIVVRNFINCLYTGELCKDIDFQTMFAIADKYGVHALAQKCILELSKSVTVSNACFVLGSMKRCNYFNNTPHQERVSKFILEHFDEIEGTDGFKALSKDPTLLLSILRQRGRGKKRKREES